jgi:hypothetical protein
MAEEKNSIGNQQITSMITASSAREIAAPGRTNGSRPHKSYRSDDFTRLTTPSRGGCNSPKVENPASTTNRN